MTTPAARYNTNEVLLVARLVHLLFMNSLDCSLLHHHVSKLDFVNIPHNTRGHVAIVPGLAHGLWFTVQRLAQIILCAANRYSPDRNEGPLPLSIPKEALDQVALPPPGALAAVIHPERNPLLFVQDISSQRIALGTIQHVGLRTIYWIVEAIKRSADVGFDSRWDWANSLAMLGCPSTEFGIYHAQIIEEINKQKNGSLSEDLFLRDDSDSDEEIVDGWPIDRPKAPIESNAIAELRDIVEGLYITFPTVDVHCFPPPVNQYTPQEVSNVVEILDRLELTDVLGIDFNSFA